MNKIKLTLFIVLSILAFIIQAWPIGVLLIIWIFHKYKKPQEESQNEEAKTETRYSEFDIYRTAAEIEHKLNEDKP